MVGWANASIRAVEDLPDLGDVRKAKGIVRADDASSAFWPLDDEALSHSSALCNGHGSAQACFPQSTQIPLSLKIWHSELSIPKHSKSHHLLLVRQARHTCACSDHSHHWLVCYVVMRSSSWRLANNKCGHRHLLTSKGRGVGF